MASDGKRDTARIKGDVLLEIKGLKIDGQSDDQWKPIIKALS